MSDAKACNCPVVRDAGGGRGGAEVKLPAFVTGSRQHFRAGGAGEPNRFAIKIH
jgi:hypothetical protein